MRKEFHGGWGALVWKEWRQQWLAALLLGLLCLLGYLAYTSAFRWEAEPTALVVWLFLATQCLAASAFAAEADDRTADFLLGLPLHPLRLLLAKYLVTLVLAVLCLLPAAFLHTVLCLVGPQNGRSAWGPQLLLLCLGGVAASGNLAVVGALSRQGLGGMGALLTSGALYAAMVFLFQLMGPTTSPTTAPEATRIWCAVLAVWCVAHLWLVRAWLGHCSTRQAGWRYVLWPSLLLLAPAVSCFAVRALPPLPALVYQRLIQGPRQWVRRGGLMALPSPDGRTVALGTFRNERPSFGGAATWLLDVDTDRIWRVGPRWRESYIDVWVPSPSCWSPDGSQFRIFTHPIVRDGLSADAAARLIEEWDFRLQEGKATLEGRRPAPDFGGFSWLGDGTQAAWRPTYWEFVLPGTGEVRHCAHVPESDASEGAWRSFPNFWLDHAIVSVGYYAITPRERRWEVRRRAPELDRTECREIPLVEDVVGHPADPQAMSGDGNWLLFVQSSLMSVPHWVYSLADSRWHTLKPTGGGIYRGGFFTPDSQQLVIPGGQALHIWNLAEERWEPEVPVPPPAGLRGSSGDHANPRYAVSPKPPWRVAVSASARTVYVFDLATRTVVQAVPPEPSGDPNSPPDVVQWLGNDRLLVQRQYPSRLWVANADGSGRRQVLP